MELPSQNGQSSLEGDFKTGVQCECFPSSKRGFIAKKLSLSSVVLGAHKELILLNAMANHNYFKTVSLVRHSNCGDYHVVICWLLEFHHETKYPHLIQKERNKQKRKRNKKLLGIGSDQISWPCLVANPELTGGGWGGWCPYLVPLLMLMDDKKLRQFWRKAGIQWLSYMFFYDQSLV